LAEATLNATVRETRESAFATDIVVDGHVLKSDQSEASGGKSLGPTPHEILLASLGACTAQTVRWYARNHAIPLESVEVDLTYRHEPVEGHQGLADIFTKTVHLVGASLTPQMRTRLIDVAAKCPIQRLLEGGPIIHTEERI
jgi:putative redox protein